MIMLKPRRLHPSTRELKMRMWWLAAMEVASPLMAIALLHLLATAADQNQAYKVPRFPLRIPRRV